MERPIILKAHEVRGILDGRQSQLRRIIKIPENFRLADRKPNLLWDNPEGKRIVWPVQHATDVQWINCPFGQVGDRLWGREKWIGSEVFNKPSQRKVRWVAYPPAPGEHPPLGGKIRWKSSTQMPRWASRILLEIVSVRVERLQDISEADAWASGVQNVTSCWNVPREKWATEHFKFEWCNDHRASADKSNRYLPWDANPWVWVIEFKRVEA